MAAPRTLHSFPTRRSSDLFKTLEFGHAARRGEAPVDIGARGLTQALLLRADRKSTRLNSSHTVISYAVFCLKKKIDTIRHPCRFTLAVLAYAVIPTKPYRY